LDKEIFLIIRREQFQRRRCHIGGGGDEGEKSISAIDVRLTDILFGDSTANQITTSQGCRVEQGLRQSLKT
jgi:hypothetical protein